MKVQENGSVILSRDEVWAMAEVLDLGQSLVETLGANEPGAHEYSVEARLHRQLEKLKSLGLSVDNLKDAVDSRFRNV